MTKETGDNEDYYSGKNISSANECTGMIPTPPVSEEQEEAYSDIYPVPQQRATGAKKTGDQSEKKSKTQQKPD